MKRCLSIFGGSLMALTLIASMCLPAFAHPRPFHLVEHGTLDVKARVGSAVMDVIANGSGTATHLGAITVQRTFTLTPTDTPGIFDVDGEATLIAPTGETLTTEIEGTFDSNIGHADLAYEWTGGTGRFEHATGFTFWSVEVNGAEYDVVANGQINY